MVFISSARLKKLRTSARISQSSDADIFRDICAALKLSI